MTIEMLRLAAVHFTVKVPDGADEMRTTIKPFHSSSYRLRVEPLAHTATMATGNQASVRLVLGAFADLSGDPPAVTDSEVRIPERPRMLAESALIHTANVIAIAEGSGRILSSPIPCIGLRTDDKEEQHRWEQTPGIASENRGVPDASSPMDREALEHLDDRLDGVALLAEALGARTALGAFHEYLRVFERAFALSSSALAEPLGVFLASARYLGYTMDEASRFVVEFRHPATHADLRDEFALEADIRPIIGRVKQAAYDVLFNKAEWRDPSTTRRDVYRPEAGTGDSDSTPFIQAGRTGSAVSLQFTLMDDFRVFPLDLSQSDSDFPDGWWTRTTAHGAEPFASVETQESPGEPQTGD